MLPEKSVPKVSIIIPNWNTLRWLPGCFDGLRGQRYTDFETILVDNGSTDDSIPYVEEHYPEVTILALTENRGFAGGINAGIEASRGDYIALLNADTIPQPNWLAGLVAMMDNSPPEVGSLASKMLSLQNPTIIDDAGDTLSWYGSARKRGFGEAASLYTEVVEVFSACAGAALYRRQFFEDVGLFDEDFTSYLEDIDLGLRGHLQGYRTLYVPTAEIWHQGQGAGTPRPRYVYLMTRNRLSLLLKNIPLPLLLKKTGPLLYGQLYYFLVYKQPLTSLAGIWAFVRRLGSILRQRKVIQGRKQVSNQDLALQLSTELGEIPLGEIIKGKLKWG